MASKEQVRAFQQVFPHGEAAQVLNEIFDEALKRWNVIMMDPMISAERLRQAQGACLVIAELDEAIQKTLKIDLDREEGAEIEIEEDEDVPDVGY